MIFDLSLAHANVNSLNFEIHDFSEGTEYGQTCINYHPFCAFLIGIVRAVLCCAVLCYLSSWLADGLAGSS